MGASQVRRYSDSDSTSSPEAPGLHLGSRTRRSTAAAAAAAGTRSEAPPAPLAADLHQTNSGLLCKMGLCKCAPFYVSPVLYHCTSDALAVLFETHVATSGTTAQKILLGFRVSAQSAQLDLVSEGIHHA